MSNSDYYKNKQEKLERLRKELPQIIATVALGEFEENFRRKSFFKRPWKGSPTVPRSRLLVRTGRLRRSLHYKITGTGVYFTSDAPYAEKHNEGYQGPEKVPSHKVKAHKRKMKTRKGIRRVRIEQHTRKAHTRQTNIPQRQFVGKHPQLFQIFHQAIIDELKAILK